ncbi:MAG: hypothetical protein ABI658_29055 [Acidimicrobiales bacterium]
MERYPKIHERRSIFEHVRTHALTDVPGLTTGGETLPDEDKVRQSTRVGWSAGALDGVGTHHMSGDAASAAAVEHLAVAAAAAMAQASRRHLESFYASVESARALDVIDSLIEALRQRGSTRDDVRDLGMWLSTTVPDREPVKLGIALLGVVGLDERTLDIVRVLGRHEEFTLFAAVAFRNGLTTAEPELFALAHHVRGWGRIQLVERLASTSDATIKRWILREGFRNSVMYEYLAYLAATTGDLAAELTVPHPDRELLTAAGEILTALYNGGPTSDIDDYADGALATDRFTAHMSTLAETVDDALATWEIERFVTADGDWTERASRGWTLEFRSTAAARCRDILAAPKWDPAVRTGLAAQDRSLVWRADRLAPRVGIDAYPSHRASLDVNIVDPWVWQRALALSNSERSDELLALATARLPLDDVATGALDEMGFGPGFEAHMSVDAVLGHLQGRPGKAPRVVLAALRSPVTRNRNGALRALATWPREAWPDGSVARIAEIAVQDPNDKTREQARVML